MLTVSVCEVQLWMQLGRPWESVSIRTHKPYGCHLIGAQWLLAETFLRIGLRQWQSAYSQFCITCVSLSLSSGLILLVSLFWLNVFCSRYCLPFYEAWIEVFAYSLWFILHNILASLWTLSLLLLSCIGGSLEFELFPLTLISIKPQVVQRSFKQSTALVLCLLSTRYFYCWQ